jgi:hypothetical protein
VTPVVEWAIHADSHWPDAAAGARGAEVGGALTHMAGERRGLDAR